MNRKRWLLGLAVGVIAAAIVAQYVKPILAAERLGPRFNVQSSALASGGGSGQAGGKMIWATVGGPISTEPVSAGGKKAWPGFIPVSEIKKASTSVRRNDWLLYR